MGWWGVKIKMKIVASARQNATATAPCVVVRERARCFCVRARRRAFRAVFSVSSGTRRALSQPSSGLIAGCGIDRNCA